MFDNINMNLRKKRRIFNFYSMYSYSGVRSIERSHSFSVAPAYRVPFSSHFIAKACHPLNPQAMLTFPRLLLTPLFECARLPSLGTKINTDTLVDVLMSCKQLECRNELWFVSNGTLYATDLRGRHRVRHPKSHQAIFPI